MHRHRELHFLVDAVEAHRAHGLGILRIGREAEDAGAFAVVEVALAVEAAGVARDVEVHVALRLRREIEALELRSTGQSDSLCELPPSRRWIRPK